MNFTNNGPLYPEDHPCYYNPEGTSSNDMESEQDDKDLTLVRTIIHFILAPVIVIGIILDTIYDRIATIFKK